MLALFKTALKFHTPSSIIEQTESRVKNYIDNEIKPNKTIIPKEIEKLCASYYLEYVAINSYKQDVNALFMTITKWNYSYSQIKKEIVQSDQTLIPNPILLFIVCHIMKALKRGHVYSDGDPMMMGILDIIAALYCKVKADKLFKLGYIDYALQYFYYCGLHIGINTTQAEIKEKNIVGVINIESEKYVINELKLNVFTDMANCYIGKGHYQYAIQATTFVLTIDELNLLALYCRAIAYRKMGKFVQAQVDLSLLVYIDKKEKDGCDKRLSKYIVDEMNLLQKDMFKQRCVRDYNNRRHRIR
eukprot:719967_1